MTGPIATRAGAVLQPWRRLVSSENQPISNEMPSFAARVGVTRLVVIGLAAAAVLVGLGLMAGGGSSTPGHARQAAAGDSSGGVVSLDSASPKPPATATASAGSTDAEASQAFPQSRASAHHAAARAPHKNTASMATGVSPGAPSDAQVRQELKQLQSGGGGGVAGARAVLGAGGLAEAPLSAPERVKRVIAGGNEIADFPYIWGGGHGSFVDNGYDCSGSVSYALAAGGMLRSPLDSGNLAHWGAPGRGKWITIYANAGHVYMYVAGLRFDTSGRSGPRGSRWQAAQRPNGGFVARHPPGL
jgi:cell wall-associated NlpC family hydrolase